MRWTPSGAALCSCSRTDRPADQGGYVHVRVGARRPFRHRVARWDAAGGGGLRLLRARVQVRPVVEEIVADLVQTGTTAHDIDLFDIGRPALRGASKRYETDHTTEPLHDQAQSGLSIGSG